MSDWRPTATLTMLEQRAQLLRQIREFFFERKVLEVETPALSAFGVSDVHLQNLTVRSANSNFPPLFLHTSPEYAMKRLLAAGCGSIYQLAKVFRDDEQGRFHNPEFTLLEWYRVGFDDVQLMDEIDSLMQQVLGSPPARRISYQQLFLEELEIDPLSVDAFADLQDVLLVHPEIADLVKHETQLDTLLQLAMATIIEPYFSQREPIFVYDFPASQAALAKLDTNNPKVAKRFELYFKGVELANGFAELTEASIQRKRFEQDNNRRRELGLTEVASDERFLAALEAGLPECAGVALGIDRLLMLKAGATHIDEVLAFPLHRA
ncbi:MAG: elongation factor P--(R)-beta-lysine ligase [Idiomarina sp.]